MRNPSSKSKSSFTHAVIISVALAFLGGCDNRATEAVKPLYRPSPDKDVTAMPRYRFSSFAGTVWKTKTKTAIVESKRYTGAPETRLFVPQHFDPAHPNYAPAKNMKIIAELPPGARLRIERLMKDQGAWGGVQVEAILLDGTNANKAVILDGFLVAGNAWSRGPSSNTSWDADPAMLEKP